MSKNSTLGEMSAFEYEEHDSKDMLLREFCEEELEIPNKFLKEIKLSDNGLCVILSRDRSYVRDDWYVNLSRISA